MAKILPTLNKNLPISENITARGPLWDFVSRVSPAGCVTRIVIACSHYSSPPARRPCRGAQPQRSLVLVVDDTERSGVGSEKRARLQVFFLVRTPSHRLPRRLGGTSRPSHFAVGRLMTSSELRRLHHREVRRLLALEYAAGVDANLTKGIVLMSRLLDRILTSCRPFKTSMLLDEAGLVEEVSSFTGSNDAAANADPPHPLGRLLRARRERPGDYRTAEDRDELAPS